MTTTIFANLDSIAIITCPECGTSVRKNISKFMEHKTKVRLKFTCNCKHQFPVILERRRSIRKPVFFKGFLTAKNNQKTPITITDISEHGVKLNFLKKTSCKKNDIVRVDFTLNDADHTPITTAVRIKRFLNAIYAGCEFSGNEHYGSLGKYFLFNH